MWKSALSWRGSSLWCGAREQNKIMNTLDLGEGQARLLTHLTDDPLKYKVPDYMTTLTIPTPES